jgi:methylated-DNA-[protein]-cysteine S-methyltransferase
MIIKTPCGSVQVIFSGEAISRVNLGGETGSPAKKNSSASPRKERLKGDLARYFAGELRAFSSYAIDLSGMSPFTRKVLQTARAIPFGKCVTYSELAKKIGRPKAARAVGQALRRNPLPIIIPCHRVVGKRGDLRGFSAGLKWKRWLLDLEAKEKR